MNVDSQPASSHGEAMSPPQDGRGTGPQAFVCGKDTLAEWNADWGTHIHGIWASEIWGLLLNLIAHSLPGSACW